MKKYINKIHFINVNINEIMKRLNNENNEIYPVHSIDHNISKYNS